MPVTFAPPKTPWTDSPHHDVAAAGNVAATTSAIQALTGALDGANEYERILLKAAAGAGKSYALRRMVAAAVDHPQAAHSAPRGQSGCGA